VLGHDQISSHKATARAEKPTDQRRRDGKGRVGDDAKGLPREPQIARIHRDHDDVLALEPLSQPAGAPLVELDGNDPRTGSQQGHGEASGTGADVQHELTRSDGCVLDEASSPTVIESVVTPPSEIRPGHGGP
jgi:hypothetical protein